MKIALALLSLTLLPAGPVSAPAKAATVARDWAANIARTPAGAYVMGNPAAKVRLVEYGSMTCSHCAVFAAEGLSALKAGYVRRGLVSVEFRHAVRDRADLAASLLARCAGPQGYFAAIEHIFAAQAEWLPRAAAALDTGEEGDTPASRNAALVATSSAAGLPAIAGIAPAAAATCLGNKAEQAVLGGMSSEAWGVRRIPGTPAFLINGKLIEGSTWSLIEPQITAALR